MILSINAEALQNKTTAELLEIVIELSAENIELESKLKDLQAQHDQQSHDMLNIIRSYSELKARHDEMEKENTNLKNELKHEKEKSATYARLHFSHGTESFLGMIKGNVEEASSATLENPSDNKEKVPEAPTGEEKQEGTDGEGKPDGANGEGKPDGTNGEEQQDGTDGEGKSDSANGEGKQDGTKGEKPSNSGNEKKRRGRKGTKTNLIRQNMQNLPQRDEYLFSLETIQKLDEQYGAGNWRITFWEKTSHIEVIPRVVYTQNDYRPVIEYREEGITGMWRPECSYFYPHSVYSPSLVAGIVCDKYVMALPIYRQTCAMERLIGDSLERGSVSLMLIRAAQGCFMPIYNYLQETLMALPYSQSDETPMQVIEGGASLTHYLWCHVTGELRSDDPQIAFFEFEKTRSADHLRKYFSDGFVRTITSDCYVCYTTIENEAESLTVSNCWAHVRRRFYYAFCMLSDVAGVSEDELKTTDEFLLLQLIGEMFDADTPLKQEDPEMRHKVRQTTIAPKVDTFFEKIKEIDLNNPNLTDKLRDAVSYALNHEDHLRRFLDDPFIPIDNSHCERTIRPVAVGRRNWLFAYSFAGAIALAIYYTLVTTALKNDADPFFYIKYLCERMPGGIDGPMPSTHLTEEFLKSMMPWSSEYKAYEDEERSRLFSNVTLASGVKPDIAAMRNAASKSAA